MKKDGSSLLSDYPPEYSEETRYGPYRLQVEGRPVLENGYRCSVAYRLTIPGRPLYRALMVGPLLKTWELASAWQPDPELVHAKLQELLGKAAVAAPSVEEQTYILV